MFHSHSLKIKEIFKRTKCETFFSLKGGYNSPLLNVQKIFFLVDFFGARLYHCTMYHFLSITHFPSCFFLTFPLKYYLYKKYKLSNKDYLLLIYTVIVMKKKIHISFQMCTFSSGWEWRGIETDCPAQLIRTHFEAHIVWPKNQYFKLWGEWGASAVQPFPHICRLCFHYHYKGKSLLKIHLLNNM